jgi:hypothetical protein
VKPLNLRKNKSRESNDGTTTPGQHEPESAPNLADKLAGGIGANSILFALPVANAIMRSACYSFDSQ